MDWEKIFKRLWEDYRKINPSVNKIHTLLKKNGEEIINDHIAFRTFNLPGININKIANVFLASGYEEKGNYYFENKKLNAKHFEHKTNSLAPKVFISELIVEEFSSIVQNEARNIQQVIEENKIDESGLIYSGNIWNPISYDKYKKLKEESEYAAWLYVFGYRANHFTVFINYLKQYNSIDKLNKFLIDNNFEMNRTGGLVKGSEKQMLKQSSTLADHVEIEFTEGKYKIPCCYYEFAERFTDGNGKLFNAFIAGSADKIFESTNFRDK